MTQSMNDIRERARAFSHEFKNETRESAEARTFWDAFFEVFGLRRRKVASFEQPVKKADGNGGFIDLLWKGVLLVEHKSGGKNLDRARIQAFDYFPGLKDRDLPRYVVVSDFARIRLYDLEPDDGTSEDYLEFELKDLYKHVKAFAFMLGQTTKIEAPEPKVNEQAVLKLAKLHDQLAASGYKGVPLELLMTRLVFCFFADDTSIFEKNQFKEWIEANTQEDGRDLGARLSEVFDVLNTAPEKRSKILTEELAAFDYVNGGLFETRIPVPSFNGAMRESLLNASRLEWGQISPAIFGAMFQGLMSKVDRRKLGAHYTREQNILRVIGPLFLDALWTELKSAGTNKIKLRALHGKLQKMHFLDPACGCGNFLVVTYRELRKVELEILRAFYQTSRQQMLPQELDQEVWVNVDQFHGIEIDQHSAHIARLAMWLTDHQANLIIGQEFGTYFRRLPLTRAANIVVDDALALDWRKVLPPGGPTGDAIVNVVGNPPFLGPKNFGKFLAAPQKRSLNAVLSPLQKPGVLDLVAGWYVKALDYIEGTEIRCAFVSTSSIVQGEQVGVLWGYLLSRGCRIHFAHRSFPWSNEAAGQAAVDCVIIGFGKTEVSQKVIYDYPEIGGEPIAQNASNINPYLVDFEDLVLSSRTRPLDNVPKIGIGNKPVDGGYFLFTPDERREFLCREPGARSYFRRWVGSDEYLEGTERWCLYVGDVSAAELRALPEVRRQINLVKRWRLGEIPNRKGKDASEDGPAESTAKLAETPTKFHVTNIPDGTYLILPRHSGERRQYIPIGFVKPSTLAGDACLISEDATLYEFGVLSSAMHNAWVRYTCGRLTSRFRYSANIVYNNYPWPVVSNAARSRIEEAAQKVLSERETHLKAGESLKDIYDADVMPTGLRRAHKELDRAVDAAYGKRAAQTNDERVRLLFGLWKEKTDSIGVAAKAGSKRRRVTL